MLWGWNAPDFCITSQPCTLTLSSPTVLNFPQFLEYVLLLPKENFLCPHFPPNSWVHYCFPLIHMFAISREIFSAVPYGCHRVLCYKCPWSQVPFCWPHLSVCNYNLIPMVTVLIQRGEFLSTGVAAQGRQNGSWSESVGSITAPVHSASCIPSKRPRFVFVSSVIEKISGCECVCACVCACTHVRSCIAGDNYLCFIFF